MTLKRRPEGAIDPHWLQQTFASSPHCDRLYAAIAAVKAAMPLAQALQGRVAVTMKGDASPVTTADYAVQALIGAHLEAVVAGDRVISEESANALNEEDCQAVCAALKEYGDVRVADADSQSLQRWIEFGNCAATDATFWTLDPIDGTKGFIRGDQYAIALAFVVDGRVAFSVMGCPNLEESPQGLQPATGTGVVVVAAEGCGSWVVASQRRLQVMHDPRPTVLLRSFENLHTHVPFLEYLREQLAVNTDIPMDSQSKYALIADGQGDLLLRLLPDANHCYREKIWDIAAGACIVEEAGGRVTDVRGGVLDYTQGEALTANCGILATNGRIHATCLASIADGIKALKLRGYTKS